MTQVIVDLLSIVVAGFQLFFKAIFNFGREYPKPETSIMILPLFTPTVATAAVVTEPSVITCTDSALTASLTLSRPQRSFASAAGMTAL